MNPTLLLVDDNEEILVFLQDDLEEQYTIFTATSAAQALEILNNEVIQLIVSDVMMPDMDGWEVYQSMKANDAMKNIPVIIITAKAQSIDKVLGLHIAKVDDYITKPFSPTELINSVRKVILNS